jgi:hypothetical protein
MPKPTAIGRSVWRRRRAAAARTCSTTGALEPVMPVIET